MKAHLSILWRVGTTLIMLGAVEICLAIWKFVCTNPEIQVEQKILVGVAFLPIVLAWAGMVFIVPGILLLRGGLKTAKYVRYLALFGISGGLGVLLLMPFLQPLRYQLMRLRLTPGALTLGVAQDIVYLVFGFWLQSMLGRPEIADAQVVARITPASTSPPLWTGTVFALGLTVGFIGDYTVRMPIKRLAWLKTSIGKWETHLLFVCWSSAITRMKSNKSGFIGLRRKPTPITE